MNPIFDSMSGVAPTGVNIDFTPTSPVTGRYLQVQSIGDPVAIAICDIQILS